MTRSMMNVNRQRHLAALCIRAIGLLLLIIAFINFIVAFRWWMGNASRWYDAIGFVRYGVGADWTMAFLIPGVLVVAGARRLARLVVSIPREECPSCGYMLHHLTTTRCPECGYQIHASEMPPQSPRN
jgi:ribosomal protein S27AE